jgi:hypothetical protein
LLHCKKILDFLGGQLIVQCGKREEVCHGYTTQVSVTQGESEESGIFGGPSD